MFSRLPKTAPLLTVMAALAWVLPSHVLSDHVTAQVAMLVAHPYEITTALHRSDFHVRRDVRAGIDELGFARRQISVFVIRGRVTLRGRVRSWTEAQQAVAATRSVPGVSTVVNDLKITR